MNLRRKAQDALQDVSDASGKVVETTEWATVALIGVCMVSVLALVVGSLALVAARHPQPEGLPR